MRRSSNVYHGRRSPGIGVSRQRSRSYKAGPRHPDAGAGMTNGGRGKAMKALTVGGAMIDTIAIIESDRIERMTMRNAESSFLLLEEGRKTESLEISTHCGGGAVNAAIAMARLGLDVAALVKLGRDARAETVLARLMQEGVSTRWAMRDARAPSGASVLVSSHDRDAALFTFRGANTLLEPGDLREEAFAVDVVYVSGLSNQSADCFPAIVGKAKAHGAMVAANPGVRQLSTRAGAFQETLARIDILTINRAEAEVLVPSLVGKFGEGGPALPLEPGEQPPRLAARGLVGGGFEMSLAAFFASFETIGPKHIVLTDGRGGAFVGSKEGVLYCPPLAADVAGTAGAGDAFASTFAAYVALGRSDEEAVRAATVNAASVVAHVDTQTGLLSREAIDARLGECSEHLAVRRWRL
jgi:ribokinase